MGDKPPAPTAPDTLPNIECELNCLKFPSIKKDEMRVSMSVNQESLLEIWAESKSTKAQWLLEVKNVSDHGPGGIPADVVFSLLKVKIYYSWFETALIHLRDSCRLA